MKTWNVFLKIECISKDRICIASVYHRQGSLFSNNFQIIAMC